MPRPSGTRERKRRTMKRTNTQPSAPLPGSSFSPDARKIPNNVQLETGRRRSSRNGAVVFGLVVFALAVAVVLVVAQVAFGNIGVGALVLAVVAGWLAGLVGPYRAGMGKGRRAAPGQVQPRGGAGRGVHVAHRRVLHPARRPARFGHLFRCRRDTDQRPGAHQRGRGGVLDGLFRQEGVRRGGRLCRGRLVGGADCHAQGHRPGDGGRSGHAPRPA